MLRKNLLQELNFSRILMKAAKEKLEIVLSAPVQGEAGGRGVWGEFRPPSPASSVRIFSNRHRRLKLRDLKERTRAVMGARRATISLAAKQRIGSAGGIQKGRICPEPRGSFRFFGQTILFQKNCRMLPKNRLVSYLKSILAGVRPNSFSRVQNLSFSPAKRRKSA